MECKYWIERSLVARLKIEGVSPQRCAVSWSSNEYFSYFFCTVSQFPQFKKNEIEVVSVFIHRIYKIKPKMGHLKLWMSKEFPLKFCSCLEMERFRWMICQLVAANRERTKSTFSPKKELDLNWSYVKSDGFCRISRVAQKRVRI